MEKEKKAPEDIAKKRFYTASDAQEARIREAYRAEQAASHLRASYSSWICSVLMQRADATLGPAKAKPRRKP